MSVFATVLALPARLWKVTLLSDHKVETSFYILATSHLGLANEYDDYFKNIVRARFDEADDLWYEGAGGRELEEIPKCDSNVLDGSSRSKIQKMRALVAERYYQSQRVLYRSNGIKDPRTPEAQRRAASSYTLDLDEFELIQANRLALASMNSSKQKYGQTRTLRNAHETIVESLVNMKPKIAQHDIDSRFGIKRAYCDAGPERLAFMQDQILGTQTSAKSFRSLDHQMQEELADLIRSDGEVRPRLLGTPGLEKTFICDRNLEWLNEIKRHLDGKNHFLALGAAHVFDLKSANLQCDGILSLLRKEDAKVKLIEVE